MTRELHDAGALTRRQILKTAGAAAAATTGIAGFPAVHAQGKRRSPCATWAPR